MKKRALFVASYGDFFVSFLLDKMEILRSFGYEILCAANFERKEYNQKTEELKKRKVILCHVPFERSPFSFKNIRAYKRVKKILKREKINLLDCHNPVAGALARLAAARVKTPFVIYTAHGFFFYKGAGLTARLFYKPIEFHLAKKTDIIITMSEEDYLAAQKMRVRKGVEFVHGMGVDLDKARAVEGKVLDKRAEFGITNELVVVCVGECIPRKNQKTALQSFAHATLKNAKLIIVGGGADLQNLKKLAEKLGIENRVIFLGYRTDVLGILKCADVFLFPSFQEGLSIAVIEAMASGLPVVCSDIRGNRDCVDEKKGGFLFEPTDFLGMARAMILLGKKPALREKMGRYNQSRAQDFSKEQVQKEYEKIYAKIAIGAEENV